MDPHETPLIPSSRRLVRTGWDPKIVAERKKLFENDRFTKPTVTHTTVPSSAAVPAGWKQISEHRLSKTDPETAAASTHVLLWHPGSRTLGHRKWYSVADLRLSFKMASQHSLHPDITRPRVRHQPMAPSPLRRNTNTTGTEEPSVENTVETPKKRLSHLERGPQSCPRNGTKGAPFCRPIQTTAPIQPAPPRSGGRADHLASLCIAHGSDFQRSGHEGGLRSLDAAAGRQAEPLRQTANECTDPLRANNSGLFLQPRVVSVKISTISEASETQNDLLQPHMTQREGFNDSDPVTVKALRRVFDKPQEQSLFYPFSEKGRRDAFPSKSRLSLPIMVSTAVAATTQARPLAGGRSAEPFRAGDRCEAVGFSLTESRDGAADSPTRHHKRNRLRKRKPSPVKERIGLFEQLSCPTSTMSLPSNSRSKSYDPAIPTGKDKKRLAAWEFKHGSRLLRALSFGSVRRTSSKVKAPIVEHNRGTQGEVSGDSRSNSSSVTSRTKSKGERFSFLPLTNSRRRTVGPLATIHPAPNQDDSPEREPPSRATQPSTMAFSTSLASNRNTRETSSSLFHAPNPRKGQAVYPRKSYGVLSTKPAWEEVESTIFRDPFKHSAPINSNNASDNSSSGEPPSTTSHVSSVPILSPAKLPLPVAARRKHRYPSSYGRKAGNTLKRGAARPILSEEEGRAVPPMRRSSRSLSWGRRAAAAAFAVGRRLKESRGSGRQGQAVEGDGDDDDEGGGRRTLQRGSEEWDVFVARPRGGLQHPRPSRVVNMQMFDDEALVGGTGVGGRGL